MLHTQYMARNTEKNLFLALTAEDTLAQKGFVKGEKMFFMFVCFFVTLKMHSVTEVQFVSLTPHDQGLEVM